MSRFWKKFLHEGRGILSREPAPRIHLGAFGKHPGWDDHIDDIGLDTESLLLAKQILYVDGIGGQINTGEWEKLEGQQDLAEFKHVFAWKRDEAFLIGKIWSSRDGKNRTKYPMIECIQGVGVPFDWALGNLLPILDRLETRCKEVLSADEVRALVRQTYDELRRLPVPSDEALTPAAPIMDPNQFADYVGVGPQHEGLYRIVYYIQTQMAAYLPGVKRDEGTALRPGQMRLPTVAGLPAESLSFWIRFLEPQLGKDVPILLIMPTEQAWLDVTIGEPGTRELYSLRATPEVLTVASDVPYTITDDFRNLHRDVIQKMAESDLRGQRPARTKKWFT